MSERTAIRVVGSSTPVKFTRAMRLFSLCLCLAGFAAIAALAPPAPAQSPSDRQFAPALLPVAPAPGIYVTNPACNSVTTYPLGASGNVAPLQPEFCTPSGVAVDSKGNIYIADSGHNSVVMYAPGSSGDATPSATIVGSNTGLNLPLGIAVDAGLNIYVVNGMGNSVTIYPAGSTGNATPSVTIAGGNTTLNFPQGIAVDGSGKIYVANRGANTVAVFAAATTGNVAPSTTISGTDLNSPSGVALDSGLNIYVVNDGGSTVTVYAAGSSGNATPSYTIGGGNTGLKLYFRNRRGRQRQHICDEPGEQHRGRGHGGGLREGEHEQRLGQLYDRRHKFRPGSPRRRRGQWQQHLRCGQRQQHGDGLLGERGQRLAQCYPGLEYRAAYSDRHRLGQQR